VPVDCHILIVKGKRFGFWSEDVVGVDARIVGLTVSKRSPAWTSGCFFMIASIVDGKLLEGCFSLGFMPLSGSRRLAAAGGRSDVDELYFLCGYGDFYGR